MASKHRFFQSIKRSTRYLSKGTLLESISSKQLVELVIDSFQLVVSSLRKELEGYDKLSELEEEYGNNSTA